MPQYNATTTAQTGPTDELLLSDVRDGKLDSFGTLYERYVSMARAVAIKHTSNPTLSEDIVSEAFVRILQALKNGRGPKTFMGGYLATTIAHLAAENGLIRQKEVPSDDDYLESASSLDETVLRLNESDELIAAFTSLPERWQTVLWMTEVEAKKPREVAMSLNLSANAVSALATRARESLREGFLKAHQNAPKTRECEQYGPHLSSMVRGSLTRKRTEALRVHLAECSYCTSEYLTLSGINKSMRVWVFPVLAGLVPIVTDSSRVLVPFLTGTAATGVTAGSSSAQGGMIKKPNPRNQTLAGTAAVLTVLLALAGGIAVVGNSSQGGFVGSATDSREEQGSSTPNADDDAGSNNSQDVGGNLGAAENDAAGEGSADRGESQNSSGDSSSSDWASNIADEFPPTQELGAALAALASEEGLFPTPTTAFAGESAESSGLSASEPLALGAMEPDTQLGQGPAPDGAGNPAGSDLPGNSGGDGAFTDSLTPVVSDVPANPGTPQQPLEPIEPGQPLDPVQPIDPANPGEPLDPADPLNPVDPADPAKPLDPAEPGNPANPGDPVQPVEPIDPNDPGELIGPAVPADPNDWVGTPEYEAFMQSVPWDTFGQPAPGNRLCMVRYTVWGQQTFFVSYIPRMILEHPQVFYILEEAFGIDFIDSVACYS